MRQRSGGVGEQTSSPDAPGRQSPEQHSLPTEQLSPSGRQGRGAQYALMFIEAVS
jgi:hypothetical protein